MAFSNLKDLYIDQLQDLYSADKQAAEMTRQLRDAAKNESLRTALDRGVKGIEEGLDTLSTILEAHDADPTAEFCKGMQGLVREAEAHAIRADFADPDVRDASIITQYQRMTHYGIAGYGCVAAFARRLGLRAEADKLEKCLEETRSGDTALTHLAEGEINEAALA